MSCLRFVGIGKGFDPCPFAAALSSDLSKLQKQKTVYYNDM